MSHVAHYEYHKLISSIYSGLLHQTKIYLHLIRTQSITFNTFLDQTPGESSTSVKRRRHKSPKSGASGTLKWIYPGLKIALWAPNFSDLPPGNSYKFVILH